MKFVLVNYRVAHAATCGICSARIGFGYPRDLSWRRFYCDHDCYLAGNARSVPIASGAGIDDLPIGGAGGLQSGVWG